MATSLSVIIPTFNVERILEDCLKTVSFADEVICIDMGSLDNTKKVCKNYGTHFIHNVPKEDNFDLNRKIGMERAEGKWILKLDSDERLTIRAQRSIEYIINQKGGNIDGYKIRNRIFFFNKEILHGFKKKNSHELRLFRNNKWIYNPFKFHQQISVKGKTDFIDGRYLHFNSQSISSFIERLNRYTELNVEKDALVRDDVDFFHVIFSPLYMLVKNFFFGLGFMDGTYGLIVNVLYSIYNFIYKIKIWQKRNLNYI